MTIAARFAMRLAERLCSAHLLRQVVEPAVADAEYEYARVRGCGDPRATGVLIRGCAMVLLALLIAWPRDVVIHRRWVGVSLVRLVTGVASVGLSPSVGAAWSGH